MEPNSDLSPRLKRHLQAVAETSGLPPGDESFAKIADVWKKKRAFFSEVVKRHGMVETDRFARQEPRGAVALTYSGSLISLGTYNKAVGGGRNKTSGRWFEYASIKLRKDVPDVVMAQLVELVQDMERDKTVEFTSCPIRRSSEILVIAIFEDDSPEADQDRMIKETTTEITDGFLEIHKDLA